MKVSIITPTTGNSYLAECIESVRAQTYENIEHIVVVDGKDRWEKAEPILRASEFPNGRNEHICVLPYPTGTNRYNGHRVYGAATYFADGDYHIWLDDDNMISPNHFVKKQHAVSITPVWYRKFREPGQMEIDRAIAAVLMHPNNKLKFDCTRDYTVKYRVGNTGLSVQADFFIQGNQKMLERHNGKLPWKN